MGGLGLHLLLVVGEFSAFVLLYGRGLTFYGPLRGRPRPVAHGLGSRGKGAGGWAHGFGSVVMLRQGAKKGVLGIKGLGRIGGKGLSESWEKGSAGKRG